VRIEIEGPDRHAVTSGMLAPSAALLGRSQPSRELIALEGGAATPAMPTALPQSMPVQRSSFIQLARMAKCRAARISALFARPNHDSGQKGLREFVAIGPAAIRPQAMWMKWPPPAAFAYCLG
jgi:hypothetical protein